MAREEERAAELKKQEESRKKARTGRSRGRSLLAFETEAGVANGNNLGSAPV